MKVSVALAYYNGGKYIEDQVRSILSQLEPDDELVISVDACTDGSKEILYRLSRGDLYGRVRVLRGPAKGVVRNFEYAIRRCRGDIIFLADQDDRWIPGKRQAVLKAMQDEEVQAVLHDAVIVDEKGMPVGDRTLFDLRKSSPGGWKNFIKNSYVGCCMAFRRELVPLIVPIPRQMYMHDYWIGTIAEKTGKVALIREPYLEYRRHEGTVTELKHGSLGFMIRKRIGILHCLILLRMRVSKYRKQTARENRGRKRR